MLSLLSLSSLLVLVLLLSLNLNNYTITNAIPLNTNLPRLEDTDMIELYHLRSFPLLSIQSTAGSFHIQTSGLALRSTNSPTLIVLEFKPVNFSNAYLPLIVNNDDGTSNNKTLIWDKRAMLSYMNEIDKTYWQQSTFLARVNGVVYENYVKWIHEYLDKDRYFVPQSICSSLDEKSCFTFSETWDSFVGDSLRAFAQNAVQMHAIISPRASDMQILSFSEPESFNIIDNFDHEDQSNSNRKTSTEESTIRMTENDIARYYAELMDCMQAYQLEEFTSALRSCMSEQVGYIHIEGKQYYEIRPRHPFVLNREYLQPIPDAQFAAASNTDIFDYTIAGAIVLLTLVGLFAALYKMKMFEFVLHKTSQMRRRNISMKPPVEGGYSKASELPVYQEWGTRNKSNSNNVSFSPISYSSLPTEPSHDSDEGTDVIRSTATRNGDNYCSIANLYHNFPIEENVIGIPGYKNSNDGKLSSRNFNSSSSGDCYDNDVEMTSPSKFRKNPSPITHKPINMYSE